MCWKGRAAITEGPALPGKDPDSQISFIMNLKQDSLSMNLPISQLIAILCLIVFLSSGSAALAQNARNGNTFQTGNELGLPLQSYQGTEFSAITSNIHVCIAHTSSVSCI